MSDELLNKIYDKVEKISEDVGELKVTSAIHEETLQTHVKRSDTLEALYHEVVENDIKPLQKDMSQIQGAFKLITILVGIGSFVVGVLKLFGKI